MNDESSNAPSAVEALGLKTIKGVSKGATYVVVAENAHVMVALKPEVQVVYYDDLRRFFQIGFRIHVRPVGDKELPPVKALEEKLNIGHLSTRKESSPPRYVGYIRIPACDLTISPWVVQDHIVKNQLIEKLIGGLYERLSASGLTFLIPEELMVELSRERFLDMIPNNKSTNLPECKVFFGDESYYPPKAEGAPPPPPPVYGEGQGDN